MAERRKIGNWIESGCLGSGTFGMVKLWCNEVKYLFKKHVLGIFV